MTVGDRLKIRIPEADADVMRELSETVSDRLCIRLGVDNIPEIFESICVDATVKMYRRMYYEGITSEGAAGLSTSFVDDILAEYDREIDDWKCSQTNVNGSGRKVRFL